MRISDWSSDVCSSDLVGALGDGVDQLLRQRLLLGEIADDGLALRALQAAEVESCRRKEVAQLRFCLGAQGEGEQDRQAADAQRQALQQLQRGRIDPVQILDDDEQRPETARASGWERV